MIRKPRFGLLSLLLLTTLVAVILYLFMPYNVAVSLDDAADYGLQLPNQVKFVASKSDKLRFKTARMWWGGYRARGTLVCPTEKNLFCYSKRSNLRALYLASRQDSPLDSEELGNIEVVIVDINDVGAPGMPYFLLTDKSAIYYVDDVSLIGAGAKFYEYDWEHFSTAKKFPGHIKLIIETELKTLTNRAQSNR